MTKHKILHVPTEQYLMLNDAHESFHFTDIWEHSALGMAFAKRPIIETFLSHQDSFSFALFRSGITREAKPEDFVIVEVKEEDIL